MVDVNTYHVPIAPHSLGKLIEWKPIRTREDTNLNGLLVCDSPLVGETNWMETYENQIRTF